MLDDLDHELERRGHTFVRYADDLRVYVASERAAQRVLDGVTVFVERRLKLKVNRAKSGVAPATRRGLLGFGFFKRNGTVKIRLDPKAKHRLKARLRQLTSRRRSVAMPSASPSSTGSSAAGAPTSRWPRRPRCSPSSTSGSGGGCGRSAGRSGSGLPRGAATSLPSVSPTGRLANGRPAGKATGGLRFRSAPAGDAQPLLGRPRFGPPQRSNSSPSGALANRRMRTRTSGGVGGGGVTPPPTRLRPAWAAAWRCKSSGDRGGTNP